MPAKETISLKKKNDTLRKELSASKRELKIEASLDKVRSIALGMTGRDDMLKICKTISQQLAKLGIKEIRNIQTAIFYESRGTYMNYEFYAKHKKTFITETLYTNHKIAKAFASKMLKGKGEIYITHIKGKKVKEWLAYQKTTNVFIDKYLNTASSLNYYWHSLGPVALGISTYHPLMKDELDLFQRFLKVFELAYRRYLDIEKAEEQAREARIEASLEKVRAQALGMRKPEDLTNVCEVLYKELRHLGFSETRNAMINIHNDEKETFVNYDYSDEIGKSITPLYYNIHPVIKKQIKQVRKADDAFSQTVFKGKDLKSWKEFRRGRGEKEDKRLKNSSALYYYFYSIGTGSIGISTFSAISPDKQELLKRFRNVFAFAYRRYMDVALAETQAKEARIELGLEKVRARAMAMQHSDELAELVATVFRELNQLDFSLASCIIWIHNPSDKSNALWIASDEMNQPARPLQIVPFYPPFFNSIITAWKAKDPQWIFSLSGAEKKKFQTLFFKHYPELPDALRKPVSANKQITFSASFNHFGALEIVATEPLSDEKFEILHRFGKVFDSSYTRFNDLKKAEAQAREAQIESALERVRSRTMAMHNSRELNETAELLYKELTKLGIEKLTCGFTLLEEKTTTGTCYMANPGGSFTWEPFHLDHSGSPVFNTMYESWKKKEVYSLSELTGQVNVEHNKYLAETADNFPMPVEQLLAILPPVTFSNAINFRYGYLLVVSLASLSKEQCDIISRFARVFEQTYTRFLDLQKAEAQAREGQIQLAMERVRARTMAMQKSDELPETSFLLFQQMKELGEPVEQLTIGVVHEENNVIEISATIQEGMLKKIYRHSIHEPFMMSKVYKAWKAQRKTLVVEMKGDELNAYNKYRNELTKSEMFPTNLDDEHRRIVYAAFFSRGMLALAANEPRSPQSLELLERFASVFDLTYTRFLDLQKAEEQAREAQIEAAMEKVRSRSLAMQKPDELTEVAELLRKEMGQLGVEELETSSIYIVDKEKKQAECWYAIKDIREENKQLISDEMTITFDDTWVGTEMGKFYRAKKEHTSIVMKGDNRKEWINYCAGKSKVLQGYYGDEIPERTYHLVKFNGGYMGAASPGDISAESWDLLRRAASVFSLAYTRFNDLQIAEAHAEQAEQDLIAIKEAKQKAETALTELQATQKQLIQSEKMASLGELTAGIAHEIQNPLNFVNNFSEVSKELLDEMKVAIEKGDTDEAKEIMSDVIQNLEKINHHGKRADGIVKGMLQHSRSSSGQKESTDINALADEYLRLAYHGLRAKDKSFNATMKTDFDETIGNINIIPQDIGRVILNLITNAFYAAPLPPPDGGGVKDPDYVHSPTVWLTTKKEGNKVLISVRDNGPGIPQKILDKIFQPFFTTKPTGQGTGLGLSLSYDIVKAHGGEIKVETKEGEGTTFIILLTGV